VHNEEAMPKLEETISGKIQTSMDIGSTKRPGHGLELGSRYHIEIKDKESYDRILLCLEHNKGTSCVCASAPTSMCA